MKKENEFGFAIHEIKNKLQVLILNSEVLERYLIKMNISDENVLKFTNRMKEESMDLYRFILDISYIFKKANNIEEFSLNELLNELIDIYNSLIDAKKIKIIKNYDPKIKEVSQDKKKLNIIIGNILKNSLDLKTKKNEITIRTEKQMNTIRVTITNYGEKINEKLKKNIFEAGFSTKEEGTGLGLYIVKELIEQLNGSIDIESTGDSTSFVLTFPDKLKNK
ncbi:HAMP domain-containing histidine kinase [bacterium]|nr:HAMP domain-containing histidine kinase [bacterium]